MRIACLHVPQFALQCLGRVDPSLRGAAVAVVGAGMDAAGGRPSLALHSPIVLACSRAAWALGVRIGMTASAARFVSPEVRVMAADLQLERETVRAIADALLGVSAVVDTGGRVAEGGAHLAMYCEVPSKTRGTTFGDRLLELMGTLGLAVRIGIADDRFTAWVAAAHGGEGMVAARDTSAGREDRGVGERGVISVPRGGSAAFLAPKPLSLLAITPEVQHMLEALGVRTLGEFAALPAPSVARPLEADYQALARGDSGCVLRPYAPEAPIREDLTVSHASLFGGAAAVEAVAERVALRLAGRARGAARLEVAIGTDGSEQVVPVTAERAASAKHELIELIAPVIGESPGTSAKLRVTVISEAVAGAVVELAAAEAADLDAPPIAVLSAALASRGAPRRQAVRLQEPSEYAQLGRGLPWQLSAPQALRSERRDAHRRTRRARPRRRAGVLAQPQLFGQLEG